MRRFAAAVSLVLFLILLPIGLIQTVGGPFVPTLNISELSQALRSSYVSMDGIARGIGLVCWALWFYALIVFTLRLAAVLVAPRNYRVGNALVSASGAITPRFLRRALDVAVGGTILLSTVGGVVASAPRPLPASIAVAHPAHVDSQVSTNTTAPANAERAAQYVVRPGDSLWEIAEKHLGSGFRWREIFELNQGRRFPDGRTLTNSRLIHPGWALKLPVMERELARPVEAAPTPSTDTSYSSTPDASVHVESSPQIETETEEAPTIARPTVIRLPSGGVIAASFASGVLTAQALAALRRRRSRRALSDPDDFDEASLVLDLRRQVETPAVGHLQTAAAEVAALWQRVHASLPRILLAIEEEDRAIFYISQTQNSGLVPPSNKRIGFRSDNGVVRAEVRRPFAPKSVRAETPGESGLLIPLGVARNGSAIHVGVHGTGGLSVTGPGAASFATQAILACAADSSCDDLEIFLIGDLEQFRACVHLNHVRGASSWDESSELLHKIQADMLRRARLFAEEDVDNIWDYSARCFEDRIPSVLIVATEPIPAMVGVIEAVASQAAPLGCAFVATGWKPHPLSFAVEVDSKIVVKSSVPEVPEKLRPFELGSEQIDQMVEIINSARPPGWDVGVEEISPSESSEPTEDSAHTPSPNGSTSGSPRRQLTRTLPDEEPVPVPTEIPLSPGQQTLEVRSFGNFSIIKDERLVEKGLRTKARELLALLVAHPQGVTKDRIIELLWPELDAVLAGIEFDRALYNLRNRTGSGKEHVERIREIYRLNLEHWWTDAAAFESLLSRAGSLAAEDAIETLSQALDLYVAPFCDDCYFSWVELIGDRYRALFVKGSARLANLLMEFKQADEALTALDRAIEVDPINEDLYRRAMAIEGRLGRRKAVSERFNKLQAILQDELDVDPDEETAELFRKVMSEIERARTRGT